MHDAWIDRISDSLDGALTPADEAALRAHLLECDACRTIADELRAVVAAAHAAPREEPVTDLWPGIAAAIEPSAARTPGQADAASHRAGQAGTGTPVTQLHTRRPARRFSFSAPQLAAAAVLIMALSGAAAVWLLSGSEQSGGAVAAGTIIQSAGGDASSVRTVARPAESAIQAPIESADYLEDVSSLERALAENRAQLDPATVEVIERSLEAIDRAIDDARAALDADPGNPYLHRQLDNTLRRKVDVLRRATGAQRGQS
jgi:anti-sigma factor RsiW